jgi:hypothetical protein
MEYKLKGSFLGWFFGLVLPVQEIFIRPSLAALVGPVQNILFLAHFITFCVTIAQQPGQAVVLGR